ncbi:helix-turn-helix domain-containing protein [Streptomyces malaysiensis]|uniref:helix-turn-helix domain-containing protein n=1 Tax=Streptomyces malaysiensis TaxID=92644 RepID=UPI0036BD0102
MAGRQRLHRFLQAAHYPSLAAYCRDSGMSPSALTPQIQHLERDFQGQLLIRGQHGHRMRLTDFGEKVLVTAHPYADQLDLAEGRNRKDEGDGARSTTRV